MASIDGLFEQIIHYEKTAQERKNRLQELKQSVFTTQEKGKVLQQTCCDLHNKLKQKLLELSDKELISKWLSGQEAIYQQQVTELDQQLHNIHKEKQTVEKQLEVEKENFFSRVAVFTHHYGTSNHGSKERELLYSSQLADILKDKEKLSSGLEVYKTREEEVSRLMKKRQELRNQLDKLEQENKKLTSSLCEELQRTSDLEDQRVSVTNIPATDSEFISQQEELEHEKQISVNLEDQYTQLQSQLHTLHQKIWQQQLNQRQQQLQQGQQQQHHHQYNPNSQQQQQQQKLNQQQQQQHHQYNPNSQQQQQQPNQGCQRKLPWKRHTEHYELNVSQKVDTSSKVDTSRKLLVTSSSQQSSSQDDFSEEVMEEMFNSSDEFKPVTMTTDSPK